MLSICQNLVMEPKVLESKMSQHCGWYLQDDTEKSLKRSLIGSFPGCPQYWGKSQPTCPRWIPCHQNLDSQSSSLVLCTLQEKKERKSYVIKWSGKCNKPGTSRIWPLCYGNITPLKKCKGFSPMLPKVVICPCPVSPHLLHKSIQLALEAANWHCAVM